jgi:hypothetical protein
LVICQKVRLEFTEINKHSVIKFGNGKGSNYHVFSDLCLNDVERILNNQRLPAGYIIDRLLQVAKYHRWSDDLIK